ncbi:hypothetical protein HAP94_04465 [Acidithiobacillus ferrivorans]|nr:hypothetical protein [Acidithiobacillus ferrivorans]
MNIRKEPIQIGQRVHSTLYGGRDGVISHIYGDQSPESCHTVCDGVGVTGGRAHVDIVWKDGTVSNHLSESFLRCSVQWELHDDYASPEEVKQWLDFSVRQQIRRDKRKAERERKFAAELERLILVNPLLLREGNEPKPFARAVKNVRLVLKQHFSGVKFSVCMENHSTINIKWTDGPTSEQVQSIIRFFEAGRFNGMDDIYDRHETPWNTLFGSAEYIFTYRQVSAEITQLAIDTVWQVIPGNLKGIEKPRPEALNGSLYPVIPGIGLSVDEAVRGIATAYDAFTKRFIKPGVPSRTSFLVEYALGV